MAKKKATPEQVITALQEANGLQAGAARKLNVTRQTIANYIKNDPAIAEAYEQVNETTIDKVEGKLLENINAGNVVAQIFYLKTKAKHRGYVERREANINVNVSELTNEQLERIANGEDPLKVISNA